MPAVLIEMGFLTNAGPGEGSSAGADFQTAFVQARLDAIVRFRDHLAAADGEPMNADAPASSPALVALAAVGARLAAVRRAAALGRPPAPARGRAGAPAPAGAPGRKIKARLFYVADDGTR